MSSSSKARFVAITNVRAPLLDLVQGSGVRDDPLDQREVEERLAALKLDLDCGDGDRNVISSARCAVSSDMSNCSLSALCRETWQYGQACSQRRQTTNMCKLVKSGSRGSASELHREQIDRKLLSAPRGRCACRAAAVSGERPRPSRHARQGVELVGADEDGARRPCSSPGPVRQPLEPERQELPARVSRLIRRRRREL